MLVRFQLSLNESGFSKKRSALLVTLATLRVHGSAHYKCYSAFHKPLDKLSEVRLKFPKIATNLAISLRNCQSNCELRNKVVNFTSNFVGKLRNSSRAKLVW